ncbi:hemolysin III family protein [Nakamurella sp. PAMC28650]|jgi:hemolysin III|uniref:PAQR family membrane homeostasis protein TrhA n=1 Tax=Nakamurella sp. PAMC28650 TaxID=2762325 RepID=UPI00164E50EE|nr:hemolysin III family protein [Nakamurella sp. PAMC28650]QNK80940.1 hemolysin III family protein [Nakamurella sp. PAMC28650]
MSSATVHRPPTGRPRARGWIHWYSAMAGGLLGVVLVVMAATTVGTSAAISCTIYAITIVGLFGISATYHRHTWISPRARTWMKRADHSMIFVFIAGTYTPLAVLAVPGTKGTVLLAIVWIGAVGGVALKMLFPNSPRWLGVPFYVALGWVAVFAMPQLLHNGGVAVIVLIITGGLLYTVGAVFYAIRRPNPWPGTFGYHEVFHAAVTLAALCHYVAIFLVLYSG